MRIIPLQIGKSGDGGRAAYRASCMCIARRADRGADGTGGSEMRTIGRHWPARDPSDGQARSRQARLTRRRSVPDGTGVDTGPRGVQRSPAVGVPGELARFSLAYNDSTDDRRRTRTYRSTPQRSSPRAVDHRGPRADGRGAGTLFGQPRGGLRRCSRSGARRHRPALRLLDQLITVGGTAERNRATRALPPVSSQSRADVIVPL
jgi:hypothetical protein